MTDKAETESEEFPLQYLEKWTFLLFKCQGENTCSLGKDWWFWELAFLLLNFKFFLFLLTKREFFSRVRGKSEAEHSHGSDENTGNDEIEEVVESPPPDVDPEGDVKVGSRTTIIDHLMSLGRNIFKCEQLNYSSLRIFHLPNRSHSPLST